MASLVESMQHAQKYSKTTLDSEYRKGMLSAAHILAMDAKHLLDSVDSVRIRMQAIHSKQADSSSQSKKNILYNPNSRPLSCVTFPSSTPSSMSQSSSQSDQSRQPSSFISLESTNDSKISLSSKIYTDDTNDSGYDVT